MQRMTQQDDQGIATIFFVLLMVVMVGAMSLAIDGGNIFSNKQSDQNGADAAALAIALSCSAGQACDASVGAPYINPGGSTPTRSGQTLSASFPAPGTVTATVTKVVDTTFGSADRSGPGHHTALGYGQVGRAGFSDRHLPDHRQHVRLLRPHLQREGHPALLRRAWVPHSLGQLWLHRRWLHQPDDLGRPALSTARPATTSMAPAASDLDGYLNKDVLVPVWDTEAGNGSHGTYHITAYAVFYPHRLEHQRQQRPAARWASSATPVVMAGLTNTSTSPASGVTSRASPPRPGRVVPGLTCKDNLLACQVYLDH